MNKKPWNGDCPICQGRGKMRVLDGEERKMVDCQCVQRVKFKPEVEKIQIHRAVIRTKIREARDKERAERR